MKSSRVDGPFLSFSAKLFLSVVALFVTFALCFIVYQQQREKNYRVEMLNIRLQDFNEWMEMKLYETPDSLQDSTMDRYAQRYQDQDLRLTIIDLQGVVTYDSHKVNLSEIKNHLGRPEVQQALARGHGYDIRRTSETTGVTYFYSATLYGDHIIRSALPYSASLSETLRADRHFIWFTLVLTLLLSFVLLKVTRRLGEAITHLREFAQRADRGEQMDEEEQNAFPHNELGEISQHIVKIYHRLRRTKESLSIEREKLLTHLQTSREGLGVFTREKKEILVNSLFIQYGNLISDRNLHTAEDIFSVGELERMNTFIDKALQRGRVDREQTLMSLNIEKNARFFIVECCIFQDLSFEISIYDVTQEEEQARLKRQLTQNIAHELKTPVSSIQGYLETMVTNPDLAADKQAAFLERCYAQSNRLSRLLRDISVLTRMDEAAEMFDTERVNLHEIVESIFTELALELEQNHIEAINNLRPSMEIRGDHSLIYSIFRNLVDNVISYAGTDIRMKVSCFREDDSFYYLSFSDTGVGVPPQHLNRLFERFYRVDKGRSRKLGGTGLGLAIVKNAVILHGGTISAKNRRDGGLEFVFTLAKDKQ